MVTTQSTDTCAVTADFALRDELRLLGNLCHDATNGCPILDAMDADPPDGG